MDERTCAQCGADTAHLRSDARFCRIECRNRWHRELRTGGPTAPRDCARCSETYIPVKRDGIYCSQRCGNLARHDARRSRLPLRNCSECGALFTPDRGGSRERAQCTDSCRRQFEVRTDWGGLRSRRVGRESRRRARQRAAGLYVVTERDWLRLVARYRGRCAYCGQRPEARALHREHVIPLARGGRHAIGNLLPACPPCNQSKGPRLLAEWRHREGALAR